MSATEFLFWFSFGLVISPIAIGGGIAILFWLAGKLPKKKEPPSDIDPRCCPAFVKLEDKINLPEEKISRLYRAEQFGKNTAIAVRDSKTHRELVGKIFQMRREFGDGFMQDFVSKNVLSSWRAKQYMERRKDY